MIIGIDFDNTIVCYDKLFYKIALKKGIISAGVPPIKDEIRNYLRKSNKEDLWTELQGYVYGPGIVNAKPFEGVFDFFMYCKKNKIKVYIISHKTKHPFLGLKYNLQKYANQWLEKQGFYKPKIGLHKKDVFFELTKEEKLNRIAQQVCTHYIDDLPEFLSEKKFPSKITKILFDTNNKYNNINDFKRVTSWHEIIKKIKELNKNYFDSEEFTENVSKLSKKSNFSTDFVIGNIQGGKNNRVLYLAYDNGLKILLKAYFYDTRNRLKAEYSFMNFAQNNNIKCVPKPYSADFKNNLGLYEFIEGRKLHPSEINEEKIKNALDFFIAVNKHKKLASAKKLPVASEACFSINEHVKTVETRLDRLSQIKDSSEIDKKAVSFINNELSKKWKKTLQYFENSVRKYGLSKYKSILEEDKCISPSDFGYHNALLTKFGKLYFIDFEYAGWDDPAKMVCDFFCQPEIPVPFKYFDLFVKAIANTTPEPEKFKQRVYILLPIYKIKWCCILLNEFLESESKRRSFADEKINLGEQKIKQLQKAKKYLESIKF